MWPSLTKLRHQKQHTAASAIMLSENVQKAKLIRSCVKPNIRFPSKRRFQATTVSKHNLSDDSPVSHNCASDTHGRLIKRDGLCSIRLARIGQDASAVYQKILTECGMKRKDNAIAERILARSKSEWADHNRSQSRPKRPEVYFITLKLFTTEKDVICRWIRRPYIHF